MIVAITGGTGFIGKKLVLRHLAQGDQVRVLSRRTSEEAGLPDSIMWCCGDLANYENLLPFIDSVDVLYHCAGEIRDASRMEAVHINGTRNLIEVAAGRIGHWVQLSSVGVYGPVKEGTVTEDSVLNPVGEYEITKTESDRIVVDAANQGSFSYSILRPSNVFGAEMANQSLFGMIDMINRGLFFHIGQPGTSANYIHVDNVVEGLVRCGTMPAAQGGTYNLSDHCTLEEFVAIISGLLGKPVPRIRLPEAPVRLLARCAGRIPGFPLTEARVDALTSRTVYPSTRIERELGYHHLVTMEEGLQELLVAWKQKGK